MARLLIALMKLYQYTFSRVFGRCCRFYPCCSSYAMEALETHGLFRGLWLTVWRLCKCHPLHPGGVDLVPPRESCALPHDVVTGQAGGHR